jgi:hypothetical protein
MISDDLNRSLPSLFAELVYGAPKGGAAFVLNPGDGGLLGSLDRLSAAEASASSHGGGTIAAHVEHLRYGFTLMNRWLAGENPFATADWAGAWALQSVSEAQWAQLREGLRTEVDRWYAVLKEPRSISGVEVDGVIGSIVHLAYHMGAIRQIDPNARGPKAPT